jgi:probable HAF family extracellular repeat protein
VKLSKWIFLVEVPLFALALLPGVAAQDTPTNHRARHHHYKLVVIGTFGGPTSAYWDGINNISVLNRRGSATGGADTLTPDPFSSTYWWSNGLIQHAFRWRNGSLMDLGALPGNVNSMSSWISSNGLVAGFSENGQIDPVVPDFPEIHAILWRGGKVNDLGTLPQGGYESQANSVNNRGQVVGTATNLVPDANSMIQANFILWNLDYGYQSRAFIWDEKKGMRDLGTLPNGTDAEATLINEGGQVVGHSYTSSGPGACASSGYALTTGSFIWDEREGMKNIGGLGGTCTLAQDLNNQGQVVGESTLRGDKIVHPFIWERATGIKVLRTLGGNFGNALAINEKGEAAGLAYLKNDSTFHATLWKHPGQVSDLGTVGDDPCSFAYAVNDESQVVGLSSPSDCVYFDVSRPFLWEHGSMVDLNNLIPKNSPLQLVYAFTINHRGEIAGNGWDASSNEHSFVLIPCDDGHPGIEGCDYSLIDAAAITAPRNLHSFGRPALGHRHFGTQTGTLPIAENGSTLESDGIRNHPVPDDADSLLRTTARTPPLLREKGLIQDLGTPSGTRVDLQCVKRGGQCPPRTKCCPGLKCVPASTRYFCEP